MPLIFFNKSYRSSAAETSPELLEVVVLKIKAFKVKYFNLKKCLKLSPFVPRLKGRFPPSSYLLVLAALGFLQALPK